MSRRRAPARPAGKLSRWTVGLTGVTVLTLAPLWALVGVDYATGPGGQPDEQSYVNAQATVAGLGVAAALLAGIAGLRFWRSGRRRERNYFAVGFAVVLLALPPWLFFIYSLSSN